MLVLGDSVSVFGINTYTTSVIKSFNVKSIIDDYYKHDNYLGIPVVKSSNLPLDAPIINCAGGKINTTQEMISKYTRNLIHYAELQKIYPKDLKELVFNENFSEIYRENKKDFEHVRTLFEDDESKKIYDTLLKFRNTQEVKHLKIFKDNQDKQYFEDFLHKSANTVFYDIGCFDGQTSIDFLKWNTTAKKVVFFEPLKKNYQRCQERLKNYKNIEGRNIALGCENAQAYIAGSDDTAVVSSETGELIASRKLDDLVSDLPAPPTFIKMDVEGQELNALIGMSDVIKKYRPQIAISVYHKPKDFFQIPFYINSLFDEYKIYLRHYTESIYETVMFFVPKKKDHL